MLLYLDDLEFSHQNYRVTIILPASKFAFLLKMSNFSVSLAIPAPIHYLHDPTAYTAPTVSLKFIEKFVQVLARKKKPPASTWRGVRGVSAKTGGGSATAARRKKVNVLPEPAADAQSTLDGKTN